MIFSAPQTRKKPKCINRFAIPALVLLATSPLLIMAQSAMAALVPCSTSENPDPCTLCHLVLGVRNIFEFLLALLFIACILFIVVAGVLYMVSSGNKSLMDWAKKAITYSLSGFLLFLLSWVIVTAVLTALDAKRVSNWWTFTCDTKPTTPQSSSAKPASSVGTGQTSPAAPGKPAGPANTASECNPSFGAAGSPGCSGTNCVPVTGIPIAGCETSPYGSGKCYMSPDAAARAQTFYNTFNGLTSGTGCRLQMSSAIRTYGQGKGSSSCHTTGTCADFNCVGCSYQACEPILKNAAQQSGAVRSYLNEYKASGCTLPGTRTGDNFHVNF